jgi:hypothetical protein
MGFGRLNSYYALHAGWQSGRATRSPDAAQRAALAAWCAADPGPTCAYRHRSRPSGAARRALHRVRDTSGICARRRQVICPSGGLSTGVSSLISDFPKNISVFTHPKSSLELTSPHRGAYRDRHGRGVGCGGRGSVGARWGRRAGLKACERHLSEQTNDADAYGKIVWS